MNNRINDRQINARNITEAKAYIFRAGEEFVWYIPIVNKRKLTLCAFEAQYRCSDEIVLPNLFE